MVIDIGKGDVWNGTANFNGSDTCIEKNGHIAMAMVTAAVTWYQQWQRDNGIGNGIDQGNGNGNTHNDNLHIRTLSFSIGIFRTLHNAESHYLWYSVRITTILNYPAHFW